MAPGTKQGLSLLSLGPRHIFKVQRKGPGAFSGHGETQSLLGGDHSCHINLVCNLSAQQDKNIS